MKIHVIDTERVHRSACNTVENDAAHDVRHVREFDAARISWADVCRSCCKQFDLRLAEARDWNRSVQERETTR